MVGLPLTRAFPASFQSGSTYAINDLFPECSVGCFDFAYSIVARSGSFAMVGSRLAQNEEYLKAVKDHILGMIVTTRVQFLLPDCLKQ